MDGISGKLSFAVILDYECIWCVVCDHVGNLDIGKSTTRIKQITNGCDCHDYKVPRQLPMAMCTQYATGATNRL